MPDLRREALCFDPLHGYMPFVSNDDLAPGEVSERQIIDHPWLQRLRQIHQLQTAWWVFPSAEHTRFQHVLGVMHLASRAASALYPSLQQVCPDSPSRGYVECLLRLAGLLHDIGHGPFGHFFDEHYLSHYGLTHETLGSAIIQRQLGDMIRHVRRNPNGALEQDELLDPAHISLLITRPKNAKGANSAESAPRWLIFLRSLFSGIYTIDNMDFVLRDAYMSGYNTRAYDLERLLRYSFFSESGLTIHARGLDALMRFIAVRAELFRTIYFHRTVRAIDLELKDLFADSRTWLFPGNPLEKLDEYLHFTEWSLLVDVGRWHKSSDPAAARNRPSLASVFRSPRAVENDLPAHAGISPRRRGAGQHFQQGAIRRAGGAIGITGTTASDAAARRPGAPRASSRHARPRRGAKLPVRSGAGAAAPAGRRFAVSQSAPGPAHLPHLRRRSNARG